MDLVHLVLVVTIVAQMVLVVLGDLVGKMHLKQVHQLEQLIVVVQNQ